MVGLSLKDRCSVLNARYDTKIFNATLLSKIYKLMKIKKKRIKWVKVMNESRQNNFAKLKQDLANEILLAEKVAG